MHSVQRTRAGVISCYAGEEDLNRLPSLTGSHVCRVAPDEVMIIVETSQRRSTHQRIMEYFQGRDSHALVLDQSDGWVIRSLIGNRSIQWLSHLTAIQLPHTRPAFLQGAVADGSAKLLLLNDVVHILVPFPQRDHFDHRLRDVAGDSVTFLEAELAGLPAS